MSKLLEQGNISRDIRSRTYYDGPVGLRLSYNNQLANVQSSLAVQSIWIFTYTMQFAKCYEFFAYCGAGNCLVVAHHTSMIPLAVR